MHLHTKWWGDKIRFVCWIHVQNPNGLFKSILTCWSTDGACMCCGLLFINVAIRLVHLYFKFSGGSLTFGRLRSDYALHLKAPRTQNHQCGKPDRFAVNRRAAQHRKNLHMHLYKGIHVLGWPFLSWVASCTARQGARDHHRNPPFHLSAEPDPHWSQQIWRNVRNKWYIMSFMNLKKYECIKYTTIEEKASC